MPSARMRPFTVATILFDREELDAVRAFLEAIAPDQSLAFLLLEDDRWSDDERTDARTRAFGAARLRHEVVNGDGLVEPNGVYFLARGKAKAFLDGELVLNAMTEPEKPAGIGAEFFSSMGTDHGNRACVIVYAGARVDIASHGDSLTLIAEQGGLVLVQDQAGEPFRRIMRAAEHTNSDATLVAPDDLANVVMEHAEPLIAETRPNTTTPLYRDVEAILPALCEVLRNLTGHDFSQYKSSTLIRRTLRRLHFLRVQSAEEYLERLRSDDAEATRLFNDLLVSVTSFFRDTDAFRALQELAIPRLFDTPRGDNPVRIWVPGCATGEEAYSIAMLIREFADTGAVLPPVQIFATDLDEGALAHARRGRYTPARLSHVPPERLTRFFTRAGTAYQVSKDIRDMVLFTRHSLTNDPPFSNLDLISCRNLLIYLGDELHRRVIPLFHYALKPRGLLFLGPAESITPHGDLFRPLDVKHRISERLRTNKRAARFVPSRFTHSPSARTNGSGGNPEADIVRSMQQVLSEQYTPQGVVVTDEGHIVATSGNVEAFLAVSTGPFVNNITRMVRDGLRVAMRSALRDAIASQTRAVHSGATLNTAEGVQRVTVTVQPLPPTPESAGLFLVVFQPAGQPISTATSPTPQHTEAANALIERLEIDLTSTREELQRTVQDLEAVNEELKSSNEELLSMNEELQSSNEELEASKEDLEALNDTLERTNNDLANLLVSTGIPTLFLDQHGNVRRTTPATKSIYNLRVEDVGRQLGHFTHRAVSMPALPSAEQVRHVDKPLEDEVEMLDGTWYLRRVLPYVTPDGRPEGIVITFTEVTDRRRYEAKLLDSEKRLRTVIDSMFAFVGVLDIDGTLLEVNEAPLGDGRLKREEVIGKLFWDCAWWAEHADVRERLREAFQKACQGDVVRYDEVVRTAAGHRVHIDFMMQPVFRDGVLQFVIPSAVDITHRVQAEAKLREQRNVTRTITDNATTAIFMMDADRRCTFANPAAELMTGYTAPELLGQRLHDLLHHMRPNGTPYAWEDCPLDRALPVGGEIRNLEETFVRRDGQFFPVVCNASVITLEGGAPGMVLEVRDVSHEQLALRAAADGQARFRQLAESIPQLAWMAHPDGDIFWYNQRWYDYTGTTLEEMKGWGWESVHDPDSLPLVMDRWQHAIANAVPFDMVFPLRGADGMFRPFLTRINPFKDEDGRVVLWFGTNTDVSEERARGEELRRRQRELQTITDNSPDILARFDRDGRHVFVNRAIERATGLATTEFIGRTYRELGFAPELCAVWESAIAEVFLTGQEQTVEFDQELPNGRQFYVGRIVPELGADGEVQFALGVTRNRTAEHVAEDALRESNRRKDEFLATLAHELRNPLAPLRNGLEIIRLNNGSSPDGVRDIMERQLVTMTRLIDDLLDISRISLGKVELRREIIPLASIVDAAIEVSRPSLQAGNHQLVVEVPDGALNLYADATRLAQVLGNLLHNAAKYTPENGLITLSAERENNDVVIRVTDNGIGIPRDMLTRVFEMFSQIAPATTRSQGGLGIGLALVRQLVDMHGGSVRADSDGTGMGSRFIIRLPLSGAAEFDQVATNGDRHALSARDAAATANAEDSEGTERLTLLVVDDNVDAAQSLASVLKLMGHDARSAFTGADALEVLASTVPEFVFLDLGLPDMSGYELAASIRRDVRLDRTIVVALTGWGSNDHRRRSVEAGFDYHLTKPADVAIIRRILARAVR